MLDLERLLAHAACHEPLRKHSDEQAAWADDLLQAAAELAALRARVAELEEDAARFRWLCEDLAGAERERRNRLLDRMAVTSYWAMCRDIDAARLSGNKTEVPK